MISLSKADIRKEIAEKKITHLQKAGREYAEKIFQQIESLPEFQQATTILLYHSLKDEVYTHDFIEKWYNEKNILLPVVDGDHLILYKYEGESKMKTGAYGIKEPVGDPIQTFSCIDMAIIPGVAFDKDGNRLGRGKGYYDRLLPSLSCLKVGICFTFQLRENIPSEVHDIPMDHVITETELIAI